MMNLIGTKEGSALVFMRDGDFKSLKYDFKDSNFYTETRKGNWRKVKSAGLFFKGISLYDVIDSFEDPYYREFLKLVLRGVRSSGERKIQNVATLLKYIPKFQHMESWILLGINFEAPFVNRTRATYSAWRGHRDGSEDFFGISEPVNIFQKDVLTFMREAGVKREEGDDRLSIEFDDDWVRYYKQYTDLFVNLCSFVLRNYHNDLEVYEWTYELLTTNYGKRDMFLSLMNEFHMEYKALFNYLVKVDRTEAVGMESALRYLYDYLDMSKKLRNHRAVKYPDNLTLRHNIVARNYRTKMANYSPDLFKEAIDYSYDWMNKDYAVIAPLDPEEMRVEGNKLNHCVANYITRVINGTCQIMFMRDLQDGNEPLVTLEIIDKVDANSKIVGKMIGQVSRYDNQPPTMEQVEVLKQYAKKKRLFYKDYDPTEDIKEDNKKKAKGEYDNAKENGTEQRTDEVRPVGYTYAV